MKRTSKGASASISESTARRTYKQATECPSPYWELPFNFFPKRGGSYKTISHWRVPPTDDYGLGCRTGREYAAHFVQFLKDNPNAVGSNHLGHIAKGINFADETSVRGYWVGFFSYLERIIEAGARYINVFDDADRLNAHSLKLEAMVSLEGEEEGETVKEVKHG